MNNLHFLIDNLPLSQFEAQLSLRGMSYEGPFMKLLSTHALLLEIVIIFSVCFSPRVFSEFLLTCVTMHIRSIALGSILPSPKGAKLFSS